MKSNSRISSVIENLVKLYQQKYGVAVFNIVVKNLKNGVEVKGSVLTENQRDYIVEAFRRSGMKIKRSSLEILSDASKRNEIGWAVVKVELADLKSRFVQNRILNGRILKRIRCSQVARGEILRVLFKKDDQLLVQQSDLTLGWVNRNQVVLKKTNSFLRMYEEWKKGDFAVKNKALAVNSLKWCSKSIQQGQNVDARARNCSSLQDMIVEEAKKYLGTKYVIGGKSKRGIDCSGLVQMVYKDSLGIILPRHSWDQKRMGREVKLGSIKNGDLVFLVKKKNSFKHVGIVEILPEFLSKALSKHKDAGEKKPSSSSNLTAEDEKLPSKKRINLIHASFDKKKVIRQNLAEIFKDYDFVEARRIVK